MNPAGYAIGGCAVFDGGIGTAGWGWRVDWRTGKVLPETPPKKSTRPVALQKVEMWSSLNDMNFSGHFDFDTHKSMVANYIVHLPYAMRPDWEQVMIEYKEHVHDTHKWCSNAMTTSIVDFEVDGGAGYAATRMLS
eukprot:gene15470-21221_t